MVYGAGDIPVGDYSSTNLANIGIGHGAVDGGGAIHTLIRKLVTKFLR
jgi:hypothetical protein